jgi:phosphoglycolate phosphatase-like HAD superfamily hydrolase
MQKQTIRTIIFDLDGTLFQTEGLAVPAFRDTIHRLRDEGMYNGPEHSEEVLLSMFGKTNSQIWAELLPAVSAEVVAKADEYMLYYELLRLHQGQGAPYPGVVETLKALQKTGYRLCIASNGGEQYVSGVAGYYFDGLFEGIYSAGGYGTHSKVDLVKLILKRFSDGASAMVGDRSSDVEAGKMNGLLTIGCNYGFCQVEELVGSDYVVTDFVQLRELFIV